jgi:hypothetical protein
MDTNILLIILLFFFLLMIAVMVFSGFILWMLVGPKKQENGELAINSLPETAPQEVQNYLDKMTLGRFSNPEDLPLNRPEETELLEENPLEVV